MARIKCHTLLPQHECTLFRACQGTTAVMTLKGQIPLGRDRELSVHHHRIYPIPCEGGRGVASYVMSSRIICGAGISMFMLC